MSANKSKAALMQGHIDKREPHCSGESGTLPPRSRHFYFNGQYWFFRTRERITFGPYDTFHEAEQNLKLYPRRCGIVQYKQQPSVPR